MRPVWLTPAKILIINRLAEENKDKELMGITGVCKTNPVLQMGNSFPQKVVQADCLSFMTKISSSQNILTASWCKAGLRIGEFSLASQQHNQPYPTFQIILAIGD